MERKRGRQCKKKKYHVFGCDAFIDKVMAFFIGSL